MKLRFAEDRPDAMGEEIQPSVPDAEEVPDEDQPGPARCTRHAPLRQGVNTWKRSSPPTGSATSASVGELAGLKPIAAELGVDQIEFEKLVESDEIRDELIVETDRGLDRGVFGVPTFFVGEEMFAGQGPNGVHRRRTHLSLAPARPPCSFHGSRPTWTKTLSQPASSRAPVQVSAQFSWEDPFLLDQQLTEDERLTRDTARDYARDKLLPRVTEAYLNEDTDREIFREMGALGLIRRDLSHEEYGCAAAGYVSYGLRPRAKSGTRSTSGLSLDEQRQSSLVIAIRSTPTATMRSSRLSP